MYVENVLNQSTKSPTKKGGRNAKGDTGFSSDEEFENPSETVYRNGAGEFIRCRFINECNLII